MRALALAATLLAFPAVAEEELGLDLSEEEVPEEFRAALAVIGVTAVEGSEPREVNRATLIEAELLRQANANPKFSRVVLPGEVSEVLGPDYAEARQCADFACLSALAAKLSVQRVITATVAKGGTTSLLTVYGVDPTQTAVVTASAESGEKAEKQMIGGFSGLGGKSAAQKDKDFVKKSTPAIAEVLEKLGTPLAKLVVDCFENTAETTLNGKVIGKGSFSLVIAHGVYKLATTGEGFLPFEKEVKLEAMKVESVRVTLVARPLEKPVAPPVVEKPKGSPILSRPGLYVAAGGVVLLGLAIGLGASTLGITNQDTNQDGILDVSRAQVKSAQGAAIAADILYGVGGAAVIGGGLWFFLAPSKKGPSSSGPTGPRPSDEPENVGGGGGMTFIIGASGSF